MNFFKSMKSIGILFLVSSALQLTSLFGRFDDFSDFQSDWSRVFNEIENDPRIEIDSWLPKKIFFVF